VFSPKEREREKERRKEKKRKTKQEHAKKKRNFQIRAIDFVGYTVTTTTNIFPPGKRERITGELV